MSELLRSAKPGDHGWIVSVIDDWWGRPVARAVPKLFLEHFHSTSLVAEVEQVPVGFLIGFVSPSVPEAAYIHFVGVDPKHRARNLGRTLYERFFDIARSHGRTEVAAITNPINEGSIAFHRRLGFEVSDPIDGYDRPGVAHVRFHRQI